MIPELAELAGTPSVLCTHKSTRAIACTHANAHNTRLRTCVRAHTRTAHTKQVIKMMDSDGEKEDGTARYLEYPDAFVQVYTDPESERVRARVRGGREGGRGRAEGGGLTSVSIDVESGPGDEM